MGEMFWLMVVSIRFSEAQEKSEEEHTFMSE